MKLLAIGLVLAFAPACIGDDPDHLDAVNTGGVQSPLVVNNVPETLHARLLKGIGTSTVSASTNIAGYRAERISDWATTEPSPEFCNGCTVTLLHHMTGGDANSPLIETVSVYSDQANLLICSISLSVVVNEKTIIRADTCGTESQAADPISFQSPGAKQ